MARILIVEDDPDSAAALERFLANAEHEVVTVRSGGDALGSLMDAPPDLIVLDLLLPRMDGAELLSVMRSYFRLKPIPVVVWTGAGESAVLDRARSHNVSAVVMKGNANYNELLAAISAALASPAA